MPRHLPDAAVGLKPRKLRLLGLLLKRSGPHGAGMLLSSNW